MDKRSGIVVTSPPLPGLEGVIRSLLVTLFSSIYCEMHVFAQEQNAGGEIQLDNLNISRLSNSKPSP